MGKEEEKMLEVAKRFFKADYPGSDWSYIDVSIKEYYLHVAEKSFDTRQDDPETGYCSKDHLGHDYGEDSRCDRCGGRGMCHIPPHIGKHTLCLRCMDEWCKSDILEKHMLGGVYKKQWEKAYQEFLKTPVSVI